jgi:hypothetical protein
MAPNAKKLEVGRQAQFVCAQTNCATQPTGNCWLPPDCEAQLPARRLRVAADRATSPNQRPSGGRLTSDNQ